ncbi:hypothetical protein [Bacillus cereus]|uniref:hypothetical protein n=1 Tax=Bacillus cereus TaxID=1396 RepID=UPI000BFE5CB4|nr:hypothetical protein [Bacillus cereus]PGP97487.1 hypothetical protein COA09_31660 [Bacillus cereus]PGS47225.1 hypothetical protein COC67_29770 [Bacillus cereus]PGU89679.1 hypothetical protein COD77_31120 [Bacillus cereus]
MKKTMKNILVGFALLSGIVMAGGNPVSADTNSDVNQILKDSNGNPIVYGQEYYMESYDHPGYRTGIISHLGTITLENTNTHPIKFQKSIAQFEYPESVDIQIASNSDYWPWRYILKMHPNYLWGGNNDFGGNRYTKYRTWLPTKPSADMNPDLTTGNYYALKNPYEFRVYEWNPITEKDEPVDVPSGYISHNGIEKELIPNPTLDSKAMWRFIPKQ